MPDLSKNPEAAMWNCPNCQCADNPANTIYCKDCGTPRPAEKLLAEFKEDLAQNETPNDPFKRIINILGGNTEMIKKIIPLISAGAVGVVAVILVITFFVSLSEKIPAIEEHNALQAEYEAAVQQAEQTIGEYQSQTAELNTQIEELGAEITAKNAEIDGSSAKISELQAQIKTLSEQKTKMAAAAGKYGNISEEYSTAKYAEEKLTEIIISQQNDIYALKKEANEILNGIYSDLFNSSEYHYELPEPMDIKAEAAKEVISAVAGAYDSEIIDFAASVAGDVIDGNDLASALGSKLQSTAQDKLLDVVTGGLSSKFNDVMNVASDIRSAANSLSNTTPNYVLKHMYLSLEQSIVKVGNFIDDETVTTEDLLSFIEASREMEQILAGIFSIKMHGWYIPSLNLVTDAETLYGKLITDNDRMPYYFALMEG